MRGKADFAAMCSASSLMVCSASGSERPLDKVEMHLYQAYEADAVVFSNLVFVSGRLKR